MNSVELEARLARLEKRISHYRLATGALGLGLIALVGMAANAPTAPVSPEIRTHRLVVIDEGGKEVARMFPGANGGVFDLLNKEGFPVVRAGSTDKGGKVTLGDNKGQQYIELMSEEAGGQLTLADKKGTKNLMKPAQAKESH